MVGMLVILKLKMMFGFAMNIDTKSKDDLPKEKP